MKHFTSKLRRTLTKIVPTRLPSGHITTTLGVRASNLGTATGSAFNLVEVHSRHLRIGKKQGLRENENHVHDVNHVKCEP